MANITSVTSVMNSTLDTPYNYTVSNISMVNMTTEQITMATDETGTMTTVPTSTTTLATTTTIITTILIACTRPPPVSNSLFTFTGYDVIYTCNSGFTMSGGSRLNCDVTNGQWTNDPPSCSPLDLRPRLQNTINIPETKETIKTSDIQLIVGVLGGLLALIAFIGLLLFIAHLCGCGTPICGGRNRQDNVICFQNERRRRRISNGDVRIYHSNLEHTFYDSGKVLLDLENGRCVLSQNGLSSNSISKENSKDGRMNGNLSTFHHIDSETRSDAVDFQHKGNPMDYHNRGDTMDLHHKGSILDQHKSNHVEFPSKRKGSVDVGSPDNEDSPYLNTKLYRAQRKVQAVNSWMPHSRPIRNINTSTK